jgi:hypothetical protein
MPHRIEVLSGDNDSIEVVYTYPVPAQMQKPLAADANRIVYGAHLTAQEIADIKAGTRWQIVRTESTKGFSVARLATHLEERWTLLQIEAAAEYTNRFQYVGKWFDGSQWQG